jgi:16S rRNA processing protein RimM
MSVSGSNRSRSKPTVIEAGVVGRAHGLDGSFYVRQPVAAVLQMGTTVRFGDREAVVNRRAGTDAKVILRLEGVGTREEAEALNGARLQVEVGEAPSLGEDEYWAHDLEGCQVFDGERVVGVVERMMPLPSCEVLVVRRADVGGSGGNGGTAAPAQSSGDHSKNTELLIPLVRDAIREVDIPSKRIDVNTRFLGESDG